MIRFSKLTDLWVIKIKSQWSFAHILHRDQVNSTQNADHAARTCKRFVYGGFIRSRLPAVNCRLRCLSQPVTKPHIQESSSCNIKYRNGQKQLRVFVLHTLIHSCTAYLLITYGRLLKKSVKPLCLSYSQNNMIVWL